VTCHPCGGKAKQAVTASLSTHRSLNQEHKPGQLPPRPFDRLCKSPAPLQRRLHSHGYRAADLISRGGGVPTLGRDLGGGGRRVGAADDGGASVLGAGSGLDGGEPVAGGRCAAVARWAVAGGRGSARHGPRGGGVQRPGGRVPYVLRRRRRMGLLRLGA